jgi:hypothetical protein
MLLLDGAFAVMTSTRSVTDVTVYPARKLLMPSELCGSPS